MVDSSATTKFSTSSQSISKAANCTPKNSVANTPSSSNHSANKTKKFDLSASLSKPITWTMKTGVMKSSVHVI